MTAKLKGSGDLKLRLKALRLSFKPIGREWADETVRLAKPAVPHVTGRLRESHRRKSATQRKATVVAHYTSNFIAAGAKPHLIKPRRAGRLRFEAGGDTVFARAVHHRGMKGNQYKKRVANEALRRKPMKDALIDAWNKAA